MTNAPGPHREFGRLAGNHGSVVVSDVADEYRSLAGVSGMREDVEAELVMDMLIGALVTRVLATGAPPTLQAARQVVEIVLDGVRTREPA